MKIPGALSFQDYIKLLPSTWVFEHFLKNNGSSRKILSSVIIDETVREFASASSLSAQFNGLSKDQQIQCALVYLLGESGMGVVKEAGLEDELVRSFLVYQAKNTSGVIRYFGFDEFAAALRKQCASVFVDKAVIDETWSVSPVMRWRCINDIAVMASMASQGLLKRKQNGGLLRTASSILKKLAYDSTSGRFDTGDSAARLIVAFGIDRGIIRETHDEYRLDIVSFEKWLTVPAALRYNDLIEFTIHYSGGWRYTVLEEILARAGSRWMSVAVFPEEERKKAVEALRCFRFAGIVELHRHGAEYAFTRAIPAPEESATPSGMEKPVIVLPDFTAVLAQEIKADELFRFARIGILESLDRVYKGKIDRKVLGDSLSRGTRNEEVMEWLMQWNAPANVLETVREWIREFTRLYISSGSMLLTFDERVTSQIGSLEPLKDLLEPVRPDAVFRIQSGKEDRVREILDSMGFDPRMPGSAPECKEREQPGIDADFIPRDRWEPVIQEGVKVEETTTPFRGTKYGAELKELDISEAVHVIDYAMLTGQQIIIDYEGSPYIKPNIYTILPVSFQKGVEPIVEGELTKTRSRKQFYIRKIRRIGVIPR